MAKKKKVKKDDYPKSISKKAVTKAVEDGDLVKREPIPNFSEAERLFLDNAKAIEAIKEIIVALEQRIDRIVTAISKAKSVKGL